VHALRGVSIRIERGEYVAIMGPSGSGKSTLMNLLGCLDTPSSGIYELNGHNVSEMDDDELAEIRNREIGFVFQTFNLLARSTALRNVELPLIYAGMGLEERREVARAALADVGLADRLTHRPNEMSGGQRQRVAIGRAIVRAPKVFLFDEPLSNLDAALRGQTRIEIAKLHRDLGATTVYVTHDQVEAMTLADRVVVLRDGMIEQVGTPLELYDKPANQFVAQFIGTPQMNIVSVADLTQLGNIPGIDAPADGFVGLRPENVMLLPTGQGQFQAKVELVEALGAETLIYVTTARGTQLVARQNTRTNLSIGSDVGVSIDAATAHFFYAKGRVIAAAKTL
jgi:multiple sugar transport system ATP-binding protein